ncbi:MAG TPA: hypothetical protein VJ725_17455 [Thermoanaerobaculia bacterium]|nr:hypothetical protein [Thermoanaerobaculia bacterium]
MTWTEAIHGTVRQWTTIRDSIGTAPPVDLLTEINAVCDLCEKSEAEAGSGIERCRYCLFYQQFGGCQEVSGRMSEAVVEQDWDRLRQLVDQMIEGLEKLKVPPEALVRLAATA